MYNEKKFSECKRKTCKNFIKQLIEVRENL